MELPVVGMRLLSSQLAFSESEENQIVRAFSKWSAPGARLDIANKDGMFRFFLEADCWGHRDGALLAYFRSGWSAARTVNWLRNGLGLCAAGSPVLDFAAGFGRVTRYLVAASGPEAVTVADVLEDAVEFQKSAFGVKGRLSSFDPGAFSTETKYAFVFAGSLFSHLPERSFGKWLETLASCLSPEGALAFTTHPLSLCPPGCQAAGGFAYAAQSELLDRIPASEYGSTWVSEEYVRSLLRRTLGPAAAVRRWPGGAWNYQDLWVVGPASHTEALNALELPAEPSCYIDEVVRTGPASFKVRGWACSHRPDARPIVEVSLGGARLWRGEPAVERPDVEEALALKSGTRCGFDLDLTFPIGLDQGELLQIVVSQGEVSYVAHLDSLAASQAALRLRSVSLEGRRIVELLRRESSRLSEATIALRESVDRESRLEASLEGARSEIERLTGVVEWMRRSRFWRMREQWFRLKRLARLEAP